MVLKTLRLAASLGHRVSERQRRHRTLRKRAMQFVLKAIRGDNKDQARAPKRYSMTWKSWQESAQGTVASV